MEIAFISGWDMGKPAEMRMTVCGDMDLAFMDGEWCPLSTVKSCWEHCCRRETLGTYSTTQVLCLPIVTSNKPNIGGGKPKNLFNDQMCVVGNRRSKITEKQWGF